MNRTSPRPLSVTIIGALFIVAGTFGVVYHAPEYAGPLDYETGWVLFVRLLAVAGGVLVLRGAKWGRWLLPGWLVYHAVLSGVHSATEFVVHTVLAAAVAYALFRPRASRYFGNT